MFYRFSLADCVRPVTLLPGGFQELVFPLPPYFHAKQTATTTHGQHVFIFYGIALNPTQTNNSRLRITIPWATVA